MKRWDRLVDKFMEEYEVTGKATETVKATRRELDRWGSWLKNLRPRAALDEVNAELIIRYLRGRAAYRSKATLSGAMSKLRCMGEFLVREGVWRATRCDGCEGRSSIFVHACRGGSVPK